MIDIKPAKKKGGSVMKAGVAAKATLPSIRNDQSSTRDRLPATGKITKKRLASLIVEEWFSVTGRSKDFEVETREINAVVRAIDKGAGITTADNFKERVLCASYLPPVPGDNRDFMRLINSLRTEKGANEANTARNNRSEPYLYSWKTKTSKSKDTLEILGMKDFEVTPKELEALDKLSFFKPETVKRMVDRTRAFLGYEQVLPTDVVSVGRKRIDLMTKGVDDGLSQGKVASLEMSRNRIECDVLAEDMLYDGHSTLEDVIKFHNRISDDYWIQVEKLMVEKDLSSEEAYSELAESWPDIKPMEGNINV